MKKRFCLDVRDGNSLAILYGKLKAKSHASILGISFSGPNAKLNAGPLVQKIRILRKQHQNIKPSIGALLSLGPSVNAQVKWP